MIELNDRFSSKSNLQFLCRKSFSSQTSASSFNFDTIKPFDSHLNLNLDFSFNGLTLVKPMLKSKTLGSTMIFYQELRPFQTFLLLATLTQSNENDKNK